MEEQNINPTATFTTDELVQFFEEQRQQFIELAKTAKTAHEQEIHMRFCEAASYLKHMWIGTHK